MCHGHGIYPEKIKATTTQENILNYSAVDSAHKEQVTEFAHSFPGWSTEIKSEPDPSIVFGETGDTTLADFLSRPVKIDARTWAVSAQIGYSFNPWQLFLENAAVADKIRNYSLLRGTLNVKFTINGNGFYYGRAIAAYEPMSGYNNVDIPTGNLQRDIVLSMFPHIYLNPTTSMGGVMKLPTLLPENWIDLIGGTYTDVGTVHVESLTLLRNATDPTAPAISIVVHAWMTDVHLAAPTTTALNSIAPQAGMMDAISSANQQSKDEHGTGIISGVASGVAAVSGMLSKVPLIGPFAKATNMVATGVGSVARLFGFSRPPVLDPPRPYVHRPFGNLAVCDLDEAVQKLTVDSKQELSVDPRTVGLTGVDELSLQYIAEKETLLANFNWQDSDAVGSLIGSIRNSPMHFSINGSGYNLTSIAYASIPFRYWKGTIIYRFVVVAGAHHKGRLRVVWDPWETPATEPDGNLVHSKVVDIAETREFEIAIGWGQKYAYQPLSKPGVYLTAGGTTLSNLGGQNGTLTLYAHNQLTRAGSNGGTINILAYVRAGPDFELASPGDFIDQYSWIQPQSGEMTNPETDGGQGTSGGDEVLPETAPQMTVIQDKAAPDNLVYMGECVTSVRQLLKRYCYSEALSCQGHSGDGSDLSGFDIELLQYYRPNLPVTPGEPTTSTEYFHLDDQAPAGGYNFTGMTYINWFLPAYAFWRGSIRSKYWTHHAQNSGPTVLSVTRDTAPRAIADCRLLSGVFGVPNGDDNTSTYSNLFREVKMKGPSGMALTDTNVNPVVEVELPYQVNRRCSPARRLPTTDLDYRLDCGNYDNHIVNICGSISPTNAIVRYCAAGEDFSLFLYLGPPTVFLRSDPNPKTA